MEISIDNIITIAGLLFSGGIGSLITWRYQRKKAKAEAKQAEAEAEKTKYEATQANTQLIKDIQDSYQRLTADLKNEPRHAAGIQRGAEAVHLRAKGRPSAPARGTRRIAWPH